MLNSRPATTPDRIKIERANHFETDREERFEMSTITAPTKEVRYQGQEPRRDELGPDYAHRGQPGHLHQDRFCQPASGGVPQHFVDFSRVQHLHEGQRSARCALHHQPHLRHLRRQPCDLRDLCAEHGVRGSSSGDRRVDREPRRSRRVHVRPQYFSGQPGRRGLLRADGEGDQSQGLGESADDRWRRTPTCMGSAPSPTS